VDNFTAFQVLGVAEVPLVNAIASTFIPTDSNGAGGTQAGCAYFIDNQLAGKYGVSGHMYMQGPFVQHDLTTAVTPVQAPKIFTAANGEAYTVGANTSFSAGTMKTVPDNGMRYQYNFNLRYFWHLGLQALETYANTAYGGNFETLSAANQAKCLQDLYNNVPTQAAFNDIVPSDFFYELFFMVYSGFTMDPMYGGNKGMVGWILTANNGVNMGNFYGEGYTTKQIMVMTSPPILKPASLGQFQKGSP
jgi:gluconate 2-dehydrogenase gamma chain